MMRNSINENEYYKINKARIFLLVDLRELFFQIEVRGGINKKSSVNWSFSEVFFFVLFFNISRKNSKTGKANQLSVLNF